jgi:hypothetical protein
MKRVRIVKWMPTPTSSRIASGNCPSAGMLEYALKLVGKSHKKSDMGAMKANNAFTD